MVHRLTLCAALCLVACGSKQSPPTVRNEAPAESVVVVQPRADRMEEILAAMDDYATRMCHCADMTCADFVQTDMLQWSTKMAEREKADPRPKETEDDIKRSTQLGQKYANCRSTATGANP